MILNLKPAVRLSLEMVRERRRRDRSFYDWLKAISPEYSWDVPHLEYMRGGLDRIIAGEELKIMFLTPPRHGKSLQNTIHFSAYYLYKFLKNRVIIGAYNQDLANEFSRESKLLAMRCMPLAQDKQRVNEWATELGGTLKAVGVNGGITGRGGHLILIDDPIRSRADAYSKVYRNKVWNWYKTDLFSRLEPGGSIVLTMTPWHHDDLVHRILASEDGKNWIVVKMPAIAKDDDILWRERGEALWPTRYNIDKLLNIKSVLGTDFDALYQLEPTIASGNIIKRDWFVEIGVKDWPFRWDYVSQYYDTAFKTNEHNDYSVCLTLGKVGTQLYILHVYRKKVELPDLKDDMVDLSNRYKPNFIGVEDKASGQSLVQEMVKNAELPVKPERMPVSGDKEARAHAITPYMRNQKLYIPAGADWISVFIDEACMFPTATHDDQVDALTLALNHQRESGYNINNLTS